MSSTAVGFRWRFSLAIGGSRGAKEVFGGAVSFKIEVVWAFYDPAGIWVDPQVTKRKIMVSPYTARISCLYEPSFSKYYRTYKNRKKTYSLEQLL